MDELSCTKLCFQSPSTSLIYMYIVKNLKQQLFYLYYISFTWCPHIFYCSTMIFVLFNSSIAPLIQVLNREPTQWCNEKKQRRASSARQSSQSDRSQVRQLRIENFISGNSFFIWKVFLIEEGATVPIYSLYWENVICYKEMKIYPIKF